MGQAARPLDQMTAMRDKEGKYLTFTLAREDYGLEILKVREIIGMLDITAIPRTPPYVKGVINLRGRIIPVLDLRLKFDLNEAAYGERTCIIVVDVSGSQGPVQVGLVVDAVSEVITVTGEDLEPPPLGANIRDSYILGLAKAKGAIKILLDIDRVLGSEELAGFEPLNT